MFSAFAPPLIPSNRTTWWNFTLPFVTHHCTADIGLFLSSQSTINLLRHLCFGEILSGHKPGRLLTRHFTCISNNNNKKKATDKTGLHVALGDSCWGWAKVSCLLPKYSRVAAARYCKDSKCKFNLIGPCGVQCLCPPCGAFVSLLSCRDYFSAYPQLFNFSTIL